MKTINRCMSPKNGRHMEPICFQALCSFQGQKFWKWPWLKSFGIYALICLQKGLSRDSFVKKEVVSNYWTFSIKTLKNWDKRVLWTLFKPEFRVIEFQRCSICPSIHWYQMIWNPANFVTSYIVVKYSCIAQIIVHLFWPYEVHIFVRILKLGSTLLL